MKPFMYTCKNFTLLLLFIMVSLYTHSQNFESQKSLTVLHLDSKGIQLDPEQLGNLVRIEIGKLNLFEVMDKYDVEYVIQKNSLSISDCYGKLCLVEIGKTISVDKILTGSVELYGETIIVTLRLIDVSRNITEKTQIKEFRNLQNELQSMIYLTLAEMFQLPGNTVLDQRLSNKFTYDNVINNPDATNLNLSGPRMGITVYTGETARILSSEESKGGYDVYPAMFQFGYQFETQYLNEGNFQALFEFIPMITGLDQGKIIPSLTVMNGLRNNVNGFEIAFGPTFFISNISEGFYFKDQWYRKGELNNYGEYWGIDENTPVENPVYEKRLDSRGTPKLSSSFVFAVGKTFISGKLNLPVNAYVIPSKDGFRYGISFGYNAKK